MKKLFLPCAIILFFSFSSYSQSGQKFAANGNILSTGEFMGSTNLFPLIIKTDNKEWMRITPTGNVGIGITAPTDKLHVSGTARMLNAAVDNLMQALSVSAQSADFATAVVTGQITAGSLIVNGNATVSGQLTTSSITSSTGSIDFGNSNLLTTGTVSSSNITTLQSHYSLLTTQFSSFQSSQWTTSGTNIYYSSGNVGIGTSSPSEMLTVEGRVRISGLANPIDTTAPPQSQLRSILLDGGSDEISATSGILTFPNTNLVTTGSITSASITTQQLTISGGMLESDTIHAGRTFSVNNSLKLERQSTNNFAEVSTIDTSVALVLQRDTSGRGVGIGTTPSAGEKLSVAGDVGIINGNLRLSNLSGIGDRILMVDSNGNLKLQPPPPPLPCFGLDPFWETDGNDVTPTCDPFIGTKTPKDLVFKTNSDDSTNGGGERMRIMANGDVRFLTGGGNVMIKTDFGPGGAAEAKVGIGTENPVRSLHVYTSHYPDNPPPPCPNNDPNCIPSQGSHMGVRLDDLTQTGNQTPVRTIWDIAPISGSLVIGKGNLTDGSIDSKMILLDNGNVGIGTTTPSASAKLDVNGNVNANQFLKNGLPFANEWATASNGSDIYNTNTGNVGIGTTNPFSKLHVENNGNVRITLKDASNPTGKYFQIEQNDDLVSFNDDGVKQIMSMNLTSGYVGIGTSNPVAPLNISGPGNQHIDISSTDPLYNSYIRLMAVTTNNKTESQLQYATRFSFFDLLSNAFTMTIDANGDVACGRLKCTVLDVVPDYVFEKNYALMPLEEVEKYKDKYKHLPDVPSGKELNKNGINVGDFSLVLLKKVEELTLYMIELEKKNNAMAVEIEKLKGRK